MERDNFLKNFYFIDKASSSCGGSDLIRGMTFGGSGLIREVTFGGSDLIRGVTFGGSGLIREWFLMGGLIKGDNCNFVVRYTFTYVTSTCHLNPSPLFI
jgi:hypothetical protein